MSLNTSKNLVYLGILSLSLLSPSISYADNSKISSNGGLTFGTPGEDPYWFSIGGLLRLDAVAFEGSDFDKGTQFRSGLNLRSGDLFFGGGVGRDITYSISVESGSDRSFSIEDAYVTYHGWWENFTVSAGQVYNQFSLESSASGKWLPFMERSMATMAFGPPVYGLGVMANKWGDCYSLNVSATTPAKGVDTDTNRSDRWTTSGRFTVTPWKNESNIFQIGISASNRRVTEKRYEVTPELQARNTGKVLDTGAINATNNLRTAMGDLKAINTYGIELSYQHGPFYSEAEYQREYIRRADRTSHFPAANRLDLDKLRFHGYHVLASYVLTGESRTFNPKNGTFNQVVPDSDCGAWEIGARYSFINLRSKLRYNDVGDYLTGVDGGTANSITLGINYYLNKNVKVAANYVRSIQVQPDAIHQSDWSAASQGVTPFPADYADYEKRRKLNIFGVRLQVVF